MPLEKRKPENVQKNTHWERCARIAFVVLSFLKKKKKPHCKRFMSNCDEDDWKGAHLMNMKNFRRDSKGMD